MFAARVFFLAAVFKVGHLPVMAHRAYEARGSASRYLAQPLVCEHH